jgi:23S rRNA-/tRNA-specific pseudouridylate synthase
MNTGPRYVTYGSDDDPPIIKKPDGLRSIRDGFDGNLPQLCSELGALLAGLRIVHKFDRDTIGLMVLSCNLDTHPFGNKQFVTPPWRHDVVPSSKGTQNG